MADERGERTASIGRRLRDLRVARGLSLRELARLVGSSPSLLSQVENAKVTPSVDTLYGLARSLGVPVTAFFGEPAASEPMAGHDAWIVRRDGRKRIVLEHGVTWENLLPHNQPGLRFLEIDYAPGAHSGTHLLRHPGRDLFLVLEGELTFRVGADEHRLGPGDALSFADFEPHRVHNEGKVRARAIVCVVGDEDGHWPAGA